MPTKRPFNEWLADFKRYSKKGIVPMEYIKTPEGYHLKAWVSHVKSGAYKLTADERRMLEEAGLCFTVKSVPHFSKEEIIKSLIAFENTKKKKHTRTERERVYRWRGEIRRGEISLSDEERKALEQVGFQFEVRPQIWTEEFLRVYDRYKSGKITRTFITPEGYPLGAKISYIRTKWKKMSPEFIRKLNEHGFVWHVSREERKFEDWYLDFLKYSEDGEVKQENSYTPEGYHLRAWLYNVASGKIQTTPEQRQMLLDANCGILMRSEAKKKKALQKQIFG